MASDLQDQQLTGDDLSELHGIALQLQASGDPRAEKLWDFIADQSGGGDGSSVGSVRMISPTTSGNTEPASNSDMRPETAEFLHDLSGIGTGAYLAMRQPDPPEYEDWRDDNFAGDGSGSYASPEGQTYSDDELGMMHGLLSRQAGNPLVSQLFDGPKSPLADYMTWRNQNFDNQTGSGWEDEDGNLYSEPALQEMFAAKPTAQPNNNSGPAANEAGTDNQQQESGIGNQVSPAALKQAADYIDWRDENFQRRGDGTWEGPDARIFTDQDLRSIYEIRQKQWPQQQAQSVLETPGKQPTVTLVYPNGMKEKRTGNHPQRDNNPGNIESAGDFAMLHGGIGDDKGFAVFPTPETGWAALDANLKTSKYQNMSIDDAIAIYAPHYGKNGKIINDTPKYQANVRAALGVTGNTKLSALTPQQFEQLKQTIGHLEGFYDKSPMGKVRIVVEPPNRPNVIPKN